MKRRFLLGSRGRFFFEPVADVLDVAPEDSGRLLDVAPQQENHGANPSHCKDQVCQRHWIVLLDSEMSSLSLSSSKG